MKTTKNSASLGADPGDDARAMAGAVYTPRETEAGSPSPALTEGGKITETDKTMVGEVRYAPPSGRNGNRIPMGAHPWNTGGKKGRSGRIPAKLGMFLKELRESPDFQATLKKIAVNPRSRNFPALMKLISAYDEEKPATQRETVGTHEITVRFEREGRRITAQ